MVCAGLLLVSTASAQIQKWEYALLVERVTLPAPGAKGEPLKTLSFTSAGRTITFEDPLVMNSSNDRFFEFFKIDKSKMGAPYAADTQFQDYIGGLGWEMVNHEFRINKEVASNGKFHEVELTFIWYKRPLK
ncbi:hypothetical protein DEDE109153_02265 [Deinococcus deserti]